MDVPAKPEDMASLAASLRASVSNPIKTMEQAQEILAQCEMLRQPAEARQLAGILATTLSFYAQAGDDPMASARAVMWKRELRNLPEWAVAEACEWWIGAENQDRRWPPKPGDIGAKAKELFALVDFMRGKAMRGPVEGPTTTLRKPLSPEEREEVGAALAKLGKELRVKKFGGSE